MTPGILAIIGAVLFVIAIITFVLWMKAPSDAFVSNREFRKRFGGSRGMPRSEPEKLTIDASTAYGLATMALGPLALLVLLVALVWWAVS
jgi:hypothetical protein